MKRRRQQPYSFLGQKAEERVISLGERQGVPVLPSPPPTSTPIPPPAWGQRIEPKAFVRDEKTLTLLDSFSLLDLVADPSPSN